MARGCSSGGRIRATARMPGPSGFPREFDGAITTDGLRLIRLTFQESAPVRM